MQAVPSEAYGLVCCFYISSIFCIFYNMTYGLHFRFLKSCSSKEISASPVTPRWGMGAWVSQTNQKFFWHLGKKKKKKEKKTVVPPLSN